MSRCRHYRRADAVPPIYAAAEDKRDDAPALLPRARGPARDTRRRCATYTPQLMSSRCLRQPADARAPRQPRAREIFAKSC